MSFLKLPGAVIEAILYNLPAADLFPCLLVNKYLKEIITTSTRLELKRQLVNLGAEINPFASFSPTECLRILNESAQNWATLTPKFIYSVNVPGEAVGIWSKEGVLFCIRRDHTGILYTPLARTTEESLNAVPVWHSVDLGVHYVINFNLCLYEHDLLAVVTSTLDLAGKNAQPQFDIHVQLRRFSIPGPHPRAFIKDIIIMKSPVQKPPVVVDIVGKHLVLSVYLNEHPQPPLRGTYIYIYNWQSGILLMEFPAPFHSYQSVIFLNEHLILMPNTRAAVQGRLDIFRIPTGPNDSAEQAPIVALQLPTHRFGSRFMVAHAHCGTNPIAQDSWSEMRKRFTETTNTIRQYPPYMYRTGGARLDGSIPLELDTFRSQRPFIIRGEDALCVFSFATGCLHAFRTPDGVVQPPELSWHGECFTMQVHRKALLRAVEQYAPNSTSLSHYPRQQDSQAFSEEPSHQPTILPFPATVFLPPTSFDSNIPLPHPTPVPAISVAWTQWGGPQVTRWFRVQNMGTNDLSVCVGERCVRLADEVRRPSDASLGEAARMPIPYQIFEFNEYLCWRPALHTLIARRSSRDTHTESQSVLPFDIGTEGSGTDKSHESAEGAPATTSMNGGSDENQATTANDPAATMAAIFPSQKPFTIPGYRGVGSYDRTAFIQSMVDLLPIAPAQRENYAKLAEMEHIRLQSKINSLESAEFLPRVECELPYSFTSSDDTVGRVDWEGIMIDEERIMGLCGNDNGIIQKVEIHHFG